MIGHLYRYPHPFDLTKFLYCGQGLNRDKKHRRGETSFGRRFRRDFPNTELTQPVREQVEIVDQLDLNELETIWMFRFHTWRGYDGGMNLTFPGSKDYKNVSSLGASVGGVISGQLAVKNKTGIHNPSFNREEASRKGGFKNVESGHLQRISSAGGKASGAVVGKRNADSGRMREVQQMGLGKGGKIGGPKGMHIRWHIGRNLTSSTCAYCQG